VIEIFKKSSPFNLIFKFQFATKLDILLMAVGTLGSLANGVSVPAMIIIFTSIIDTFTSFGSSACNL
jgi:hypothetical protein